MPPDSDELYEQHEMHHDHAMDWRPVEPGLFELAHSYSQSRSDFAPAEAQSGSASTSAISFLLRGKSLRPESHVALTQAFLFTWHNSPESMQQRLQLADWLRTFSHCSDKQHQAAMSLALAQNAHAAAQLQGRVKALKAVLAGDAASTQAALLPEAQDFLDEQSRASWLLAEQRACQRALASAAKQPAFTGYLQVMLHSVRNLHSKAQSGLRKLACCLAPSGAGLQAPFFKVWLHGGHIKCALGISAT